MEIDDENNWRIIKKDNRQSYYDIDGYKRKVYYTTMDVTVYYDHDERWHREDGPAKILGGVGKEWFLHGERHREGGPATEYANGDKEWWLHGKIHREDGPAVEYANGHKEWYLHDKRIDCKSQEQFERLLKLKAFW